MLYKCKAFPNMNPWIFIKASQTQCLLLVLPFWNFDPFEILLAPTGSLMEPLKTLSNYKSTPFPE